MLCELQSPVLDVGKYSSRKRCSSWLGLTHEFSVIFILDYQKGHDIRNSVISLSLSMSTSLVDMENTQCKYHKQNVYNLKDEESTVIVD